MRWFNLWYSYAKAPFDFEKGITTGVDVFKKSHKVDPERLFIAGIGQGGMVAFNFAASARGTYKGVVVYIRMMDGRIKPGHLVLLEAMGGGFTWGSALLRW